MKKIDTKKMIELFDDNSDFANMFAPQTKDFTLVINTLELFLKQGKITREISDEVKKEINVNSEEFIKEVMKRLTPRLNKVQKKLQKMEEKGFSRMLFALPDKKGRRFYEIMADLEETSRIPISNPLKREKIDKISDALEEYISEIKEINKPFVPAKIDTNQTIVFKVKFKHRKGTWRKIELKATNTLEDLHNLIQEAMEWDNDHLYSFFMDNKFYSKDFDSEYTCPYEPEGRKTADLAKVGMFGFVKGQKFAYLFDFGDNHEFEIEVFDFGTRDKNKDYPVILEFKGKSPEQYPDYEEFD